MEIILIKSYTDKPWRSPETYQLIEDSLRGKWHVTTINTQDPQRLSALLTAARQEAGEDLFVFNIAEYLDERDKKVFLPALLDGRRIPHLGSSAGTVAVGLDKVKTKQLLIKNGIPTPRYFVADRETGDFRQAAEKIGYPLFVKPVREGGHIGIGEDSIAYHYAALKDVIDHILTEYEEPALVEEYITGDEMREFSVGIVDGETRLFTPVEIDYASMAEETAILSFEAAQKDLERIKLVPDLAVREEIIDLAERTFAAVGARDYSRVDIRRNRTGSYVLEINIMPGLGLHSFLPEAAKAIHALEYDRLIQTLAESSIRRSREAD
jgi:D-alanine-D-alanine ligase